MTDINVEDTDDDDVVASFMVRLRAEAENFPEGAS